MTDISSISFSQCSINLSPITSRSATIQLDNLLTRMEVALQQVRQINGTGVDMYKKMGSLVHQSQQKLNQVKRQNLEAHRKCLQHIEILLYQQDYASALGKIDQYKKMELTDLTFLIQTNIKQNNFDNSEKQINFCEAKKIIESPFTDFQFKQKIWLQYALSDEEQDENLTHVTYKQVQQTILQHFRKQFDIVSEMTQNLEPIKQKLQTPQKKNYKSMSILKSSAKNNKGSNFKIKNNIHEKSAGKIGSPKRNSQKRTTRKKINKEGQQNKTSKKSTLPFLA